jgi:hypothetical protein
MGVLNVNTQVLNLIEICPVVSVLKHAVRWRDSDTNTPFVRGFIYYYYYYYLLLLLLFPFHVMKAQNRI